MTCKKSGTEYALKSIPKTPPNERESKSPDAYLKKILSEVRACICVYVWVCVCVCVSR